VTDHPRRIYRISGEVAYCAARIEDDAFQKEFGAAVFRERDLARSFAVPIRLTPTARNGLSPFIPTDCPYFSPLLKSVLLSQRAIDVFGPLLDGAGQMFRTVQRQTETRYTILYVRRQVDALDEDRSEVERFETSGRIADIIRAEFQAERLRDAPIFRLPRGGKVFVTDAIADAVQRHGLTGFKLTEVWSAETGGVRIPIEPYRLGDGPDAEARRFDARRRALRAELAARPPAG
jgi:hypothetical protein